MDGGRAVLTLDRNQKVWITINGDDANPLFELKNVVYLWGGGPSPPLGNSHDLFFRNVTLEGTQKYRSEIKGWDAGNGFHDVVLENVRINGMTVDESNVASHFDVNVYVWGLRFSSSASPSRKVAPDPGPGDDPRRLEGFRPDPR
jgi:hypothetical protein